MSSPAADAAAASEVAASGESPSPASSSSASSNALVEGYEVLAADNNVTEEKAATRTTEGEADPT